MSPLLAQDSRKFSPTVPFGFLPLRDPHYRLSFSKAGNTVTYLTRVRFLSAARLTTATRESTPD